MRVVDRRRFGLDSAVLPSEYSATPTYTSVSDYAAVRSSDSQPVAWFDCEDVTGSDSIQAARCAR
jgi:hypothetical protein